MISEIFEITGIGRTTIISTISMYGCIEIDTHTFSNKKLNSPPISRKTVGLDRIDYGKKCIRFGHYNELTTINRILVKVNKNPTFPHINCTTLDNIIKNLDFVFIKRKKCCVIIHMEDLIVQRCNYLNHIHKYRKEDRLMYYLDNTL